MKIEQNISVIIMPLSDTFSYFRTIIKFFRNMKYLIGIDGGGTKTKCIAADTEVKPLYETTGGPSNFLCLA